MKQLFCIVIIFMATLASTAQLTNTATVPKRLLVVSGGGARGAWGVGVISELIKRNGGYKAVFGTSTGSLMAPLILLQDMSQLQADYTAVTQKSIFNKSPFTVNYDSVSGTVTTNLNFRAIWRTIWGFKTLGETKNLFKLIQRCLSESQYDSLLLLFRERQMQIAVAVTNTTTGNIKIVYDSSFAPTHDGYNEFCTWIWASADEPLFMSYVPIKDTNYVDGGVREVIPIQDGLKYAIDHGIDTIDVVINNSRIPIDQNWSVTQGGVLHGLERVLGIYDYGTVDYNERFAILLAKYFDLSGQIPNLDQAKSIGGPRDSLQLNFYCMPQDLAQKYQSELGFEPPAMQALLQAGLQYGADPNQYCFRFRLSKGILRAKKDEMLNRRNLP